MERLTETGKVFTFSKTDPVENAADYASGVDECTEHSIRQCISTIKKIPTIDPIRAAGGCYCGDCKYQESIDGSNDYCVIHETFCSKFCGDGKPMEAQDDG